MPINNYKPSDSISTAKWSSLELKIEFVEIKLKKIFTKMIK